MLIIRRFASAGAFGLGLPFVVQILLDRYGHAITLRVCGINIVLLPLVNSLDRLTRAICRCGFNYTTSATAAAAESIRNPRSKIRHQRLLQSCIYSVYGIECVSRLGILLAKHLPAV